MFSSVLSTVLCRIVDDLLLTYLSYFIYSYALVHMHCYFVFHFLGNDALFLSTAECVFFSLDDSETCEASELPASDKL